MDPQPARPRVCVAGAGRWGQNLVRNFHALGALQAVCETDPDRRQAMGRQYPGVRLHGTFEVALADDAIDAVVIATPAERHHAMGLAALEAGKDVFVEKPLCLDVVDGEHMVETARREGRILMVGHLLRYHPAILRIQELVLSGALGTIEYIYSNRLAMGQIRQEENALWSFAPHDVSVILTLMGQLPIQATATGGAYVQPNIADITVSSLLFSRGTRAHIFVSWLHPYKEQRLVVIGSKQMVAFTDTRPDDKLVLFDKHMEWTNGRVHVDSPRGTPLPFAPDEPLRLECAHFLECVARRAQPRTPGEDGVAVLRVLEACQRSLQMNGEPTPLHPLAPRRLVAL